MAKAQKKETAQESSVTVTESTELVTVEGLAPADIFTNEHIAELLKKVEDLKNLFLKQGSDPNTTKGKNEIISFAARIRKTRKLIDEDIGKAYVAVLKDEPGRIDKLRKQFRETLDEWAVQVRAPVTELEQKEEARVKAHQDLLTEIGTLSTFAVPHPTSEAVKGRIARMAEIQKRDFEEFAEVAGTAFDAVGESLKGTLARVEQHEKEQAELAELRKAKALREEQDRIAAAAETARLAGIEEGKRQAAAAAAPPLPQPDADELAPIPGDLARTPKPPAPTAATMGYAASKPRSAEDEKKAAVNREILADLVAYGCKEDGAKALIKAIATGTIRHVYINYNGTAE